MLSEMSSYYLYCHSLASSTERTVDVMPCWFVFLVTRVHHDEIAEWIIMPLGMGLVSINIMLCYLGAPNPRGRVIS